MTEAYDTITIRGARVHNLKNIDVDIPREKLIVITGLSGSGKSSLAFDTIYAEGRRRYVESLSAYARQFLGTMERPDVDLIEGLSPAISIEQKTIASSPRSTVGTVTEVYDFLRLLYARIGIQHCTNCGKPVRQQSIDQIVDTIMAMPARAHLAILSPQVRGRKGHYRELFVTLTKQGFTRVRIDGQMREITEGMQAERFKVHNIEVVIDRIELSSSARQRVTESLTTALKYGGGVAIVANGEHDTLFSEKLSCPDCGISYDTPEPNAFSFNSPYGACPECNGLGEKREFDEALIIPDPTKTLREGGIAALGEERPTWMWSLVKAVATKYDIPLTKPVGKIPREKLEILLNGTGKEKFSATYDRDTGRSSTFSHKFEGVIEFLKYHYSETSSEAIREWAQSFTSARTCTSCHGGRLKPSSLAVRIGEKSIADVVSMGLADARSFIRSLDETPRESVRETAIAKPIVKEISARINFLLNVGLDYLTLDRSARTLSGGEAQRIRLATQIGTQLVGVLYILDEPSIGLHQRDNLKLIYSLKELRDLGNTVIVVEHDEEMIAAADLVIDIGPGAGEHGGEIVAVAPPELLKLSKNTSSNGYFIGEKSITQAYFSGRKKIDVPNVRRKGNGKKIILSGATGNNLKDLTLDLPLGTFVAVTGVSGSGKSTLISETLYPILSHHFYESKAIPMAHRSIKGLDEVDKVIEIDQSPIGRTPRSNPATYTGLFTDVRDLFSQLSESKIRGYKVGRFSFNVKGGRCDECEGDGVKKIEMNFLPDVYVTCDACRGKRYNRETLEVHYKGKSIADVLAMTVEEATEFFRDIPRLYRKLSTLTDVGLGYIHLGQQATTLSGGEAQRIKLATELSKVGTGKTLYILDEPTTGLHFEDIRMLLSVLSKLVDKGNTVLVIEHNLDVIKTADWVIDLGPEGGGAGGYIVAEGTPEEVAAVKESYTGGFLKRVLQLV